MVKGRLSSLPFLLPAWARQTMDFTLCYWH